MSNGSQLQNKSDYDLEKIRLRFNGWQGQTHGSSHSLPSDWVPKASGTYAFPKHIKGNQNDKCNSKEN
jgi:hypothetical protein